MTCPFEIVAADRVPPAALHAAFRAAFADYLVGAFDLPFEQWPLFLGRQAVDLGASRVGLADTEVQAFAFVALRSGLGVWRLATMGAVPRARGSGVAPALLDDFIARAASARMRQVELECFAQNERAMRLYRSRGFSSVSPLYGYRRDAGGEAAEAPVGGPGEALALQDAWGWLEAVAQSRGDLPLQVTPPSLQALPARLQARRRGTAQVVFSVNSQGLVSLNSLVDTDAAQSDAQALVAGLLREFAGQPFSAAQLQRPDVGGEALERLGFERLALHQVLMRRGL